MVKVTAFDDMGDRYEVATQALDEAFTAHVEVKMNGRKLFSGPSTELLGSRQFVAGSVGDAIAEIIDTAPREMIGCIVQDVLYLGNLPGYERRFIDNVHETPPGEGEPELRQWRGERAARLAKDRECAEESPGNALRALERYELLAARWLGLPQRGPWAEELKMFDGIQECWMGEWTVEGDDPRCTIIDTESVVTIAEKIHPDELGMGWAMPAGPDSETPLWYDDIEERVYPNRTSAMVAAVTRGNRAVSDLEMEFQHQSAAGPTLDPKILQAWRVVADEALSDRHPRLEGTVVVDEVRTFALVGDASAWIGNKREAGA